MVSNWVTLAEAMVSGSGKATCKKPSDPFIMAEKKVMGSGVWTGPGLSSPPGGVVSGGTVGSGSPADVGGSGEGSSAAGTAAATVNRRAMATEASIRQPRRRSRVRGAPLPPP